jgi:hypothetical protein
MMANRYAIRYGVGVGVMLIPGGGAASFGDS